MLERGQRQRETGRVRRSEYNRVHEHDIPHRARTTAASKSLTKPVLGVLGPPKYREPSSGRIVQTCPRPHCGTALEYRRNRTGPHTGTEPAAGPLCPQSTVCKRSVASVETEHPRAFMRQQRPAPVLAHTPTSTPGICPAVLPRLPSMPRISARRQQAGSTGSLEVVQPSRLTRSCYDPVQIDPRCCRIVILKFSSNISKMLLGMLAFDAHRLMHACLQCSS